MKNYNFPLLPRPAAAGDGRPGPRGSPAGQGGRDQVNARESLAGQLNNADVEKAISCLGLDN